MLAGEAKHMRLRRRRSCTALRALKCVRRLLVTVSSASRIDAFIISELHLPVPNSPSIFPVCSGPVPFSAWLDLLPVTVWAPAVLLPR